MVERRLISIPSQLQLIERLQHITYLSSSIIFVSGDSGAAKSTLIEQLSNKISDNVQQVFIQLNEQLSDPQIRQQIITQLYEQPLFDAQDNLFSSMSLLQEKQSGDVPRLIILDNARYLSQDLLLELLQIIMQKEQFAESEINVLLLAEVEDNQKMLAFINQTNSAKRDACLEFKLAALDLNESNALLNHIFKQEGYIPQVQHQDALQKQLISCAGNPEKIIRLAEQISAGEFEHKESSWLKTRLPAVLLMLVLLMIVAAIGNYLYPKFIKPAPVAVEVAEPLEDENVLLEEIPATQLTTNELKPEAAEADLVEELAGNWVNKAKDKVEQRVIISDNEILNLASVNTSKAAPGDDLRPPVDVNKPQLVADTQSAADIKEIQDVTDVQPLADVKDIQVVTDVQPFANVKDIQVVTDVQPLADVKDIQVVTDVQPLTNVEDTQVIEELQPTADVKEIQRVKDAQSLTDVEDTQVVEELQSVADVKDIQRVNEAQPIADIQVVHDVQPVEDIQSLQEILDTQQPQTVQQNKNVNRVTETTIVAAIPEIAEIQDAEVLQNREYRTKTKQAVDNNSQTKDVVVESEITALDTKPQVTFSENNNSTLAAKKNGSLFTSQSQLLAIAPSHYTLQLSGMASEATLQEFISEYGLPAANVYIYKTQRNNKPWYVVIFGEYKSRQSAEQASKELPGSLANMDVWIKKYQLVHQDLQLNNE